MSGGAHETAVARSGTGAGTAESDQPLRSWPLSYPQALLWFLGRHWRHADLPNRMTVTFIEALPAAVTVDAVRAALRSLLEEHEPLRSALVLTATDPVQVVTDVTEPPLAVLDLTGLPAAEADRRRDERLAALAAEPVSVFSAPACRFLVVLGPDGERLLAGVVHHMFFDYWSAGLLTGRLRALLEGTGPALDPERPQYVDYASWERELDTREGVAYWTGRLRGMAPLRLPTDRPRPWEPEGSARRATLVVPPGTTDAVRQLAARLRLTPYAVLLAALVAVLWRRSGEPDVTVPTLFNGRTEAAMNEMVGYFDNILLFRHVVDPGTTVGEHLRQVGDEVVDGQEHHDVPLLQVMQAEPRLVMLLRDPRNIWPVFHYEVDQRSLDRGAAVGRSSAPDRGSFTPSPAAAGEEGDDDAVYSFGTDLDFTVRDTAGGLYLRILYNSEIFDPATIRGLLRDYHLALRRATAPDGLRHPVSWLVPEKGES